MTLSPRNRNSVNDGIPGIAFVDQKFCALSQACIPLLDWGFNKSDCVYDGIPFAAGRIFRMEDHIRRFRSSMQTWRIPEPALSDRLEDICHDLVAHSGLQEGIVYIFATRGIPPSAGNRDPSQFVSRFYAWSQELPQLGTPERLANGMSMIVSQVPRIPSSSVNATAKNLHWGDLIQARLEACDRGAMNAILLGHSGFVAEGAGFNVFAMVDRQLRTPARDCLLGITRQTVLEIASEMELDTAVCDMPRSDLDRATELFVTSSVGGIFPVTELDGKPIGEGLPGAVTRRLREAYWARRASLEWTSAVDYQRSKCSSKLNE